jgi:hypothetical protein
MAGNLDRLARGMLKEGVSNRKVVILAKRIQRLMVKMCVLRYRVEGWGLSELSTPYSEEWCRMMMATLKPFGEGGKIAPYVDTRAIAQRIWEKDEGEGVTVDAIKTAMVELRMLPPPSENFSENGWLFIQVAWGWMDLND